MLMCSIPKITVLSDCVAEYAAEGEGVDQFALHDRLAPIFDILRHKDTVPPLALALYGSAGTGKTFALKWLVRRLSDWNGLSEEDRAGHPRVLPIWFSALKHDSAECVLREMVSELVLQCLVDSTRLGKKKYLGRLVEAAESCGAMLGPRFVFELEMLGRRMGVLHGVRAVTSTLEFESIFSNSCLDDVQMLLSKWLMPEENDVSVRMALFIDDLDHSSVDMMMEVFHVLNHHLRFPNLVFVVGLNVAIAQTLVLRHYKEHGHEESDGADYLSKVFQVECHIEPSQHQLCRFLENQVELLNHKVGGVLKTHLTEEYSGYVSAAILHLSRNNPRRIKLLLNSALMKGCAASHSSGAESSVPEDEHLLFSQGVQVYLLQQWLAYFSLGGTAIHCSTVQDWFEKISQKARSPEESYALFIDPGQGGVSELEAGSSAWFSPPDGLSLNMIHEWVWDLLKIPFLSAVANFSMEPSELPVMVSVKKDGKTEGISEWFKDALAAMLEKSANDLVESDLDQVVHLDLSHQEFSANDCAMMGRLQSLERLDLNNSTLENLDGLKGLHQLKSLNLTYVSVKDISPLADLIRLETLDLSFSGAEDLSPLKNLSALTSLILYGMSIQDFDPLRGLVSLQRLNLSHTNITDADLGVLEGLSRLESLFLRQTGVGKSRAVVLKQLVGYNLEIEL